MHWLGRRRCSGRVVLLGECSPKVHKSSETMNRAHQRNVRDLRSSRACVTILAKYHSHLLGLYLYLYFLPECKAQEGTCSRISGFDT
jgi:hypothetical protein